VSEVRTINRNSLADCGSAVPAGDRRLVADLQPPQPTPTKPNPVTPPSFRATGSTFAGLRGLNKNEAS